jgi:hypothetical protein
VDAFARVERHYWYGTAALLLGDRTKAIESAQAGLAAVGALDNDEVRWRFAALLAAAARHTSGRASGDVYAAEAQRRLDGLRRAWGSAAAPYEARHDIAFVKAEAGLRR